VDTFVFWFGILAYTSLSWFYPFSLIKAYQTRSMADYNPIGLWTLTLGVWGVFATAVYYHTLLYIIGNFANGIGSAWLLVLYYKFRR